MNLYPGKMVLYRFRPGQVRAGQSEAAAMITRVNQDGTVNLTVYPDATPDPLFQKNVAQESESMPSHCWRPTPDDARPQAELQLAAARARKAVG